MSQNRRQLGHGKGRRRVTLFDLDPSQQMRYNPQMSQAPRSMSHTLQDALILSVFPGIDILGRAFEQTGFCVVRGPDIITGGDIRDFHPPKNRFSGIIGGPPCQDFSKLNRRPTDYGRKMLAEFSRVITAARPDWFLFENVLSAPDFSVPEYTAQRFALDLAWFSDFSRRRDFIFGSKSGTLLNPVNATRGEIGGTAVTGSDERSFKACCEIQGLPTDFDIPFFTFEGKKQAVANGVPMALGLYVAGLIAETIYNASPANTVIEHHRRCKCGCGRTVVGRAEYNSASCRKRAQRCKRCQCGCKQVVSGKALYSSPACRKRAQRARGAA